MILTIQAINDQGKEALITHLEERKKLSKFNPSTVMYNKMFEEIIVSQDPFILQIRVKILAIANAIKFSDLKSQIENTLYKNGAKSKDYIIKEAKDGV